MARHVGRPTNEEVASRKRKQIAKIIIPVSIVLVLVVLLSTKGLMGIMGNSVVSTTEKAYLLGDLDNSGNVDIADLTILTKYLTDPDKYKLNEYQLAAANVYKDDSNSVDQEDANALRNFLLGGEQLVGTAGNIGGTVGANYTGDIGAKYVCPASTETVKYELVNTNQCKIETINNEDTEKDLVPTEDDSKINKKEKAPIISSGGASQIENNDVKIEFTEPDQKNNYNYKERIEIPITVSFSSGDYYFIQKAYYDNDKLNYESDCTKLEKEKTYKPSLTMAKNNRKIVLNVYSDKLCTNSVKTQESSIYTLSEDQIPTTVGLNENSILNTDKLKVTLNQPGNLQVQKNTNLGFEFNFDLTYNSNYYYKWVVNKDSTETASNCYKIVNGLNAVHHITVDSNKVYGKLIIYKDDRCNNPAFETKSTNTYTIISNNQTQQNPGESQVSSAFIQVFNKNSTKTYNYGDDLTLKYKTKINGNQSYYYKVRKYYNYTTEESTSECMLLKDNETLEAKLNMIATNRKVVWDIYTDNQCTVKYDSVVSDIYKAKTKKEDRVTSNKVNTDNIVLDIIEPSDKKIEKGTSVQFFAKFQKKNPNINYYYKWLLYKNDKVTNTPSCKKVDINMTPLFSVKMNAAEIYGQIAIYQNREACKLDKENSVEHATSVKNTSKYNSIVYAKKSVDKSKGNSGCPSGELRTNSKGEYYCHIVKKPFYSCSASGYSVASYKDNVKRKYCRNYTDAKLTGYSYNCNGIGGTLNNKTHKCEKVDFYCKFGEKRGNNCVINIAKSTTRSVYNCPDGYTPYDKNTCIQNKKNSAKVIVKYSCKNGTVVDGKCVNDYIKGARDCPPGTNIEYKSSGTYCRVTYGNATKTEYCPPIAGKIKRENGRCRAIITKQKKNENGYNCDGAFVKSKTNSKCYKTNNSNKKYINKNANEVPIYSCSGIKGENGKQGTLEGDQCKLVDSVTAECEQGYTKYKSESSNVYYCIKNNYDSVNYKCPSGYKKTGKGTKTVCSKIMDK